jgi:trimeric autotransporter adhesin
MQERNLRWSSSALLALLLTGIGCSGGSKSSTQTPPPPSSPTISSLSPGTAVAFGAPFTLTVNGAGFASGATVQWNGTNKTTNFVSSTQVTASIATSDLGLAAATIPVTVTNPDGGKTSASNFSITAVALPTVTTLSPNTAPAGSASFTLTVTGTGFRSGAQVAWNGVKQTATVVVSSTQLTVTIPATLVATTGTVPITVVNTDNGDTSAAANFTVAPAPAANLTTLSPGAAITGGAGFTLTINGTGFINGSTVQWNGTNRTTTFVSPTQVTAAIPAADLASPGSATVTVIATQASGGAVSNALPFTIGGTIVQLITVNTANAEPIGNSGRAWVNQDGQYVSFASAASDLITGDTNNAPDAFVRNTCIGAAPANCAPTTTRVSLDTTGSGSQLPTGIAGVIVPMSMDGRLFTYSSTAFGEDDLRDICTGIVSGCTPATIPVSVPTGGGAAVAVGGPINISPDGRYVGFNSSLGGAATTSQAYVRDTCIGATAVCTPSTIHVSIGVDGSGNPTIPTTDAFIGGISGGGRYVEFSSSDTNVVPGLTHGYTHMFVRDTCTGAPAGCIPTTTMVDIGLNGAEADAPLNAGTAGDPGDNPGSLSDDGRYVLFNSLASNLVTFPPGTVVAQTSRVYLRDTCAGVASGCTPTTTLVSPIGNGVTNASSQYIGMKSVSANGRYATFMVSIPDIKGQTQIYVRDICTGAPAGCTPTTAVVSADPTAIAGTQPGFIYPSISGDGHYVVFTRTSLGINAASNQIYIAKTGF